MKLWDVLDGPYESDRDSYFIVGKVQVDDENPKIEQKEFHFSTFKEAYRVLQYFHKNIVPLDEEDIGALIDEKLDDYDYKETPN